jgi:phosphatidylglycerol---prolipoprotein diacylglyceryl transferase
MPPLVLGSSFLAIPFPPFDPIAFTLGPFAVHWYAMAYIVGIFAGWRYTLWLAGRQPQVRPTAGEFEDYVSWAVLGIILGGRMGYVLFYNLSFYLENPWQILALWQGGMSFHGGLIGVLCSMALYARLRGLTFLGVADLMAAGTPVGIFTVRLANFVNGELYGRVTDLPWGVIFPGELMPRHPSQLYEALLEGPLLWLFLFWLAGRPQARAHPGLIGGGFLAGYALARIGVEFVREPDAHIGFLVLRITMGQLLSVPMLVAGVWLMYRAKRRGPQNFLPSPLSSADKAP